ncbi:MAG: hypothetical protein ACKOQ3_14890 [Novosphingobium sp.]
MRKVVLAVTLSLSASSLAYAQEINIIVESMVQSGLPQTVAQQRYDLDLEARALQERLRREEPSFAGMYGDASDGTMRIFVRLTGEAKRTLARYTTNPAFVAVQGRTPLAALERRQEALERSLAARGVVAGHSIDMRTGKVRVTTRQIAQASQAVPGIDTDPDVELLDDNPVATPAVTIYGGKQTTYQSVSGTTLTSDRGSLGFAVKSGTISGILTAAHFGRCINSSGGMTPGCTVNGAAFYNPSNISSGAIGGTPSLIWQAERIGGAYDAEWRTSSTDTFPNTIQYGSGTSMAVTAVYNPDNLVVGSSKVCKQGFTTGYTCGTYRERYSMPWFGTTGIHYLVSNDAGGAMAAGGDSGGPVFAAATAIGLVSGVFTDSASTRYNQMSFTSVTLAASALGVTVKTAP